MYQNENTIENLKEIRDNKRMKFGFLSDLKMRQKFVDDYRLPIKIMDSPYFEYYLKLYWDDFQLEQKAENFQKAVDKLKGKVQSEWYRIKDSIESDVKSKPKFLELQNTTFDNNNNLQLPNGNPYNQEDGKHICVSVDIRSANYNSLKYFDKSLVLDTQDYNELISKYTDLEYFKESKIFRQLIFEPLLSKKQGQIQKKITLKSAQEIMELITPMKVKTVSNDELILLFERDKETLQTVNDKMNKVMEKLTHQSILKHEVFEVVHLKDKYFFKKNIDGTFLLRKVPGQVYAQCFKKVKNLPIEDYDLLFIDGESGNIAKYLTPIFEENK